MRSFFAQKQCSLPELTALEWGGDGNFETQVVHRARSHKMQPSSLPTSLPTSVLMKISTMDVGLIMRRRMKI